MLDGNALHSLPITNQNGSVHTVGTNTAVDEVAEHDPRDELAAVEAEVKKINATLTDLMSKTHVLKSRINSAYSPFLRLPPELISEIFQCCIPPFALYSPRETDTDVTSVDAFSPLIFGRICTAWRRIAWAAPGLWTSIILFLDTRSIGLKIALLEQWLARSGELPLDIKLVSEEDNYWVPPATPGKALEVINKYTSRWRNLDLRLPTSCYTYLPKPGMSLPLLDSVHLNPPGGQGERKHTVDMSLCNTQIRRLSLSCVYLISMNFKWDQITHLRLEAFYVDECLKALANTPNLVSCTIRNIIGGDDGHAMPDSPVVMHSLKTLEIDNEKDTSIAFLLDSLHIPNATDLCLSGRNLIYVPQLCSLISRSTSLRTFSLLRTLVSSENVFLQLLQSLKTIHKLVLDIPSLHSVRNHSSPFNDNVLKLCNPTLVVPGQTECLLPYLEDLTYRGPQSFTWSTLLATLGSRQPSDLWDPGREFVIRPGSVSDWRSFNLSITRRDVDIDEHDDFILAQLRKMSGVGLRIGLVMDLTDPEHPTVNTKPHRFV